MDKLTTEEFLKLAEKAFSNDPDEALKYSAILCKKSGVDESKILDSQEKIDELFLK
jgi:hypothetical protein